MRYVTDLDLSQVSLADLVALLGCHRVADIPAGAGELLVRRWGFALDDQAHPTTVTNSGEAVVALWIAGRNRPAYICRDDRPGQLWDVRRWAEFTSEAAAVDEMGYRPRPTYRFVQST